MLPSVKDIEIKYKNLIVLINFPEDSFKCACKISTAISEALNQGAFQRNSRGLTKNSIFVDNNITIDIW